uniref:Transmembrane protein n=1 Tax=Rhizophora mucronata TaxID=61149 RepID=A0A2P2J1V4_RHIMU
MAGKSSFSVAKCCSLLIAFLLFFSSGVITARKSAYTHQAQKAEVDGHVRGSTSQRGGSGKGGRR